MAEGYDRFETQGSGGASFMMGLLTGAALGAGLGLLFAPKAGSQLRSDLGDRANKLANTASDGYRRVSETAGDIAERGRAAYDKAREAVVKGAEEAQRYARETGTKAAAAVESESSGASYVPPRGSNGPARG